MELKKYDVYSFNLLRYFVQNLLWLKLIKIKHEGL